MEDEFKAYKEQLERAEEIKKALNLESVDTALFMMLMEDVDSLRFHNTT